MLTQVTAPVAFLGFYIFATMVHLPKFGDLSGQSPSARTVDPNNNNHIPNVANIGSTIGNNKNRPAVPPPPPPRSSFQQNISTSKNITPESSNGSQKSQQFCRICHEGDMSNCSGISPVSSNSSSSSRLREPLIAPCRCTGSVAMVHLSCLEHWLTTSNSERCELCNYVYETKRMPRTWTEFLTDSDNQFNVRNMIADLICFFLLSPLLIISTYLCCIGAHEYYLRERWEAVGLVFLSIFLLAVYFTWCHVTFKYHVGVWQTWVRTHQRIYVTFPLNRINTSRE